MLRSSLRVGASDVEMLQRGLGAWLERLGLTSCSPEAYTAGQWHSQAQPLPSLLQEDARPQNPRWGFCQPWAPDSLGWPFLGSLLSVLDSSPAFCEHGVCTLVAFGHSSSLVTHYIPNPDLNPSQVQVGFWFQMSQLKPNLPRNFPHWELTVCQLLGSVLWGCQREGG